MQLDIREINLNRVRRDQPPTEKNDVLSMGHKLASESGQVCLVSAGPAADLESTDLEKKIERLGSSVSSPIMGGL